MKTNLLILFVFISIIIYSNIDEMDGYPGLTKKNGGTGCQCHWPEPTDSVIVWIEGPDTVHTGDSSDYKIYLTGGPAVVGGFNVAVFYGTLNSVDTLTHVEAEDLVHSYPNFFINDTVVWNFKYIAKDSVNIDTLYITGNSCNGDSIPTDLDQWNHGENFVVNVVAEPVSVEHGSLQPDKFVLYQNHPNPFNPSTKIKFTIPQDARGKTQDVTLKVYDVVGNEIATLVNEVLSAGDYEVEFNPASSIGYSASGIYFYQLRSGRFVETKKMLLIK